MQGQELQGQAGFKLPGQEGWKVCLKEHQLAALLWDLCNWHTGCDAGEHGQRKEIVKLLTDLGDEQRFDSSWFKVRCCAMQAVVLMGLSCVLDRHGLVAT